MLLKIFLILGCAILGHSKIGDRQAARLCVSRQIELDKCNDIRDTLNNHLLFERLDCMLESRDECLRKIKDNEADIMVIDIKYQNLAYGKGLRPIMWEYYLNDDVIVAVADENSTLNDIKSNPLDFNVQDLRLVHSALYFNRLRFGENTCEIKRSQANDVNSIKFMRSKEVKSTSLYGKKLICKDLSMKQLSDYAMCNFETGPVNAIISRDLDYARRGELISILNETARYFGADGHLKNYVGIFGVYKGERDVIFNDDTQKFSKVRQVVNDVTEGLLNEILCDGNIIEI